MDIMASGITDIGMKRDTNQDSICLYPEKSAFMIADGMGGHNGGDIASSICKNLFCQLIDESLARNEKRVLENVVKRINEVVYARSVEDSKLRGMGTTFTAVFIQGTELQIANVGDSRTYLFHEDAFYQLTKDHSLVQEKMNLGFYTREQAQKDPQKNILTRTVGVERQLDVDLFAYTVNKGDLFLLCSDGLHGKVSDKSIASIIRSFIRSEQEMTPQLLEQCASRLVRQANSNGGQDNISVVLVYCY